MNFGQEIRDIHTDEHGKFFNFAMKYGLPPIVDFTYLHRDIEVLGENIEFNSPKSEICIHSVSELFKVFERVML